jgi:hypothetical protein
MLSCQGVGAFSALTPRPGRIGPCPWAATVPFVRHPATPTTKEIVMHPHYQRLIERTGLPFGPLDSPYHLYQRGRGTKLHRTHDWRSERTQCGLNIDDITAVTVTYLDAFDVCGKCGDNYRFVANEWVKVLERSAEALDLLERPSTRDAEEVLTLRVLPLVLAEVERAARYSLNSGFPEAFDEWTALRDRVTAQANTRLDELVPHLSGRIPVALRARFAAEHAVHVADNDGSTSGIPAPWSREYHRAAEIWCSVRAEGPVDTQTLNRVTEQLVRIGERSDVVGLITHPVMSGAAFRTPLEWARAEAQAGAERYAQELNERWEFRTRELIEAVTAPLRYVAFCDLMDANVSRFADTWPHCLDRNPAVAIFAGSPVAFLGDRHDSGIAAMDPLAAAWLLQRCHNRYGSEIFDLGPVATDGDDGRHRNLVMAEFASRWNPGRYSEFRDPVEMLALARAVAAD